MSEHTISFIALFVSVIGFVLTLVMSIVSNKKSKESIAIAKAADDRAKQTDARSTERSQVLWNARLTVNNIVELQNGGSDAACDVRVTYKIMNIASAESVGWDHHRLVSERAHERPTDPTTFSLTLQAVKKNIGSGETVGLPVPSLPGLDFKQAEENEHAFRLLLEIEWRTAAGSTDSETLYSPYLGIIWSHLEFAPFEEYAERLTEAGFEALSPATLPPMRFDADDHA